MKTINKNIKITGLITVCLILFLSWLAFSPDPADILSEKPFTVQAAALQNETIDPCELLAPGGEVSSQSEESCVAQYATNPGEKVVQIQTSAYEYDQTAMLCEGLLTPDDFHVFMKDVEIGDCGIQSEIGYKGEPAPGYTGWAVLYYLGVIHVRVATSLDYPTNQSWVYDTAYVIEDIIQNRLEIPEAVDNLPDWIIQGQAAIQEKDKKGIYIPEWLEWIKPQQPAEEIYGVFSPIDGEVWIYNDASEEWRGPAKAGEYIHRGEVVMVADDSAAEILVTAETWRGNITLADNAVLRFPLPEGESDYPNLWYLYTGVVRVAHDLTSEPIPEELKNPRILFSDFSTICGARSEFILTRDDLIKTSTIYLIEGELDYYNLIAGGMEDASLMNWQKVVIAGDGTETVLPFNDAELSDFLIAHHFDQTSSLGQDYIEETFPGQTESQGDEEDNLLLSVGLTMICCVVLLVGVGAVVLIVVLITKRSKNKLVRPE